MSVPTDARSVGELLLDADLATRRLLMEVDGQDGPPMLATFDEVVQSAGRLWAALPARPDSVSAGASMRQLIALSESMRRSQTDQNWPPAPVTRDPRLGTIADTFNQATRLVRSRHGRVLAATPHGEADLAAARARIMHTVYVGAHVVGLAVGEHVHDVELMTERHSSDVSNVASLEARKQRTDWPLLSR